MDSTCTCRQLDPRRVVRAIDCELHPAQRYLLAYVDRRRPRNPTARPDARIPRVATPA